MRTSLPISLRVWGPDALFTRQELKVDRVTYDMITPSAAKAIYEAIFWKPEIAWSVRRIELLKPISNRTLTINEVKSRIPAEAVARFAAGGPGRVGIDIRAERTQRTSTMLLDVDYLLHACLTLRDDLPEAEMTKYVQMFYRRAARGQCFQQPYFGVKECMANFALVRDRSEAPAAISLERDMGVMLHSVFDGEGKVAPSYFHARMHGGVVDVPAADGPGIMR